MNNILVHKPPWLKIRLPSKKESARFNKIKELSRDLKLFTVCAEAHCPNILECWSAGTATFMIMGDTCTRACRFCATKTGSPRGFLDKNEPKNLARAIKKLGLSYAVITSVTRDDLKDGGAGHFAKCVTECKKLNPKLTIEVLTPDFRGDSSAAQKILDAKPNVFGHNIETVKRLQKSVRDLRANYSQSLAVLEYAKKTAPKILTKSGIMLGFGEKEKEVIQAMKDLRIVGVDILTLGQYLRPSKKHIEITEFITPEKFAHYKKIGEKLGFLYVASGPFVRSSYRAGELFLSKITII